MTIVSIKILYSINVWNLTTMGVCRGIRQYIKTLIWNVDICEF